MNILMSVVFVLSVYYHTSVGITATITDYKGVYSIVTRFIYCESTVSCDAYNTVHGIPFSLVCAEFIVAACVAVAAAIP